MPHPSQNHSRKGMLLETKSKLCKLHLLEHVMELTSFYSCPSSYNQVMTIFFPLLKKFHFHVLLVWVTKYVYCKTPEILVTCSKSKAQEVSWESARMLLTLSISKNNCYNNFSKHWFTCPNYKGEGEFIRMHLPLHI